jgi:hypothetical protein
MNTNLVLPFVLVLLPGLYGAPASAAQAPTTLPAPPAVSALLQERTGLAFEESLGQGPAAAAFVARTAVGTLALGPAEAWLLLPTDPEARDTAPRLRWSLVGASPDARAEGEEPLPGVVSQSAASPGCRAG